MRKNLFNYLLPGFFGLMICTSVTANKGHGSKRQPAVDPSAEDSIPPFSGATSGNTPYPLHANGNRLLLGANAPIQFSGNREGVTTADKKVIITNDNNSLEINPSTGSTGGVTLEPINRVTGKSISTRFFIKDTASWSFFTNSSERLLIAPNGNITTRNSLLVNNAASDGTSALRINGVSRFDSSVTIMSGRDSAAFISINSAVKSSAYDPDDDFSAYTSTPMEWANGRNIPVFRLRHPSNVSAAPDGLNRSIQRDFMILPYQFGTAIEYNGVVECWVGEWSIHKGLHYKDAEGNGNGWGGILWIGDDIDAGGIRMTARNNLGSGGNMNYGEISVEKFPGAPNGNLRLRLPQTANQFEFVYGPRGSGNIIASVSNQGIVLPKIQYPGQVSHPAKGQIAYDSTANLFLGYNGSTWINLQETPTRTGNATRSGNGSLSVFTIPHGLGQAPVYFNAVPTSSDAANIRYISANASDIIVHYGTAPSTGTNNLSWNWEARR
jgi:hypothetical protein